MNDRLFSLAKQHKISQHELSLILDVSASYVSQMYNRKKKVTLEVILNFCAHMGIPLYDFFNEHIPPKRVTVAPPPDVFNGLTQYQIDLFKLMIGQMRYANNHAETEGMKPLAGYGAAGAPLFAPGSGDVSIPVPEKFLDARFFVVAARGDSMEPRIMNGDYVIVQKDTLGDRGDIVLARIDSLAEGEYMIKRFYPHRSNIEFRSFNETYPPIVYPTSDVLSVEKVVHIIHK